MRSAVVLGTERLAGQDMLFSGIDQDEMYCVFVQLFVSLINRFFRIPIIGMGAAAMVRDSIEVTSAAQPSGLLSQDIFCHGLCFAWEKDCCVGCVFST
ncbi:hypothetical protein [Pseudomonas gingeri]|uniref:hypothetical protein n=1 Tax=Pseudomonas gingeri TaxID=117681 RepID=UPI0015A1BD74|nr:hypothetical protein [Pseudomonas gingeri]NWE49129.1 hypothetical protein [Pseudomonas gingeri]